MGTDLYLSLFHWAQGIDVENPYILDKDLSVIETSCINNQQIYIVRGGILIIAFIVMLTF
jgi:hypothetical protein